MNIVHISDTHGGKFHRNMDIPKCDVLIHSGDIGGRTNIEELGDFLDWFKRQPANVKIFIPGNHDIVLDKKFLDSRVHLGQMPQIAADNMYADAMAMIDGSEVVFLDDSSYTYEGIKFYGSAYTPSFHRQYWAYNADRGREIKKIWDKIDIDTQVLITHGPPYGILDVIPEAFKQYADEDVHRGCEDLMNVIKERLYSLKLHCFGHIHEGPTRIESHKIVGRNVIFSNAAVLNNRYKQILFKPSIITIL